MIGEDRRAFETTHWSVVLEAGRDSSAEARAALESLCRIYWPPLYKFARSRGNSRESAEDLTQEFFCRLLDRKVFRRADPARGRFRTFLLSAFNHFMANEWDRAKAEKRGGGGVHFSLDFVMAEELWIHEPADHRTPEMIFERNWALQVLERALQVLRAEYRIAGRENLYVALKPFLQSTGAAGDYAAPAAELGMSEGAVRTAVHRLRSKYRDVLRATVADTLNDPAMVDEELRVLIAALT